MATDKWFVGGGAEHSPESARRALFVSTSGAEGIAGVADLKVLPLSTPGQGIRVTRGSALINSRYVGGEDQSYMGTVVTQETKSITPTGSGGGRTDLVVLRIEDPFAAGSTYSPPGNVATAEYAHIRIITHVPSNTTRLQDVAGFQNQTGIALAKISYPASTGTVTAGMITDLRKVAQPRSLTVVAAHNVTSAGEEGLTNRSEYPDGDAFPSEGATSGYFDIDIPEWATVIKYVASWSSLRAPGGRNAYGRMWLQIGTNSDPDRLALTAGRWDIDANSETHRVNLRVAHTQKLPAALRGQTKRFYPRANIQSGATTGEAHLHADWATSFDLLIVFQEQPD